MNTNLKKSGQKLARRFSRNSEKISENSKDHLRENFFGRISHVHNVRLLVFEWVLLILAVVMLATAQTFWFQESYAKTVYTGGGTYIEATIGRVNSLNPLFASTSSEKTLARLMFANLVANDRSGNPGPELLEYLNSNDTGKIWTAKLRDNLKWSDGEPITNDDVLFTVEIIQNSASGTIYSSNLRNVKVSENDSGEIVFTLSSGNADFASSLIFPLVPKHILENVDVKNLIEADFSTQPVTSGAFSYNAVQSTSTTTSDERTIYLTANENYFKTRPKLDSFAVHTFSTKDDIISAVNSGKVTATAELDLTDLENITASGFTTKKSAINSGVFIFFNTKSSNVSSAALRRAIREGINLNDLRSSAPDTSALDFPFLSSQISLETPNLPEYNLDSAKSEIVNLIGTETRTLNIATVNSGYLPAVTEKLAENLRELGFDVNVSTYTEGQEFLTNIISHRNYDLLVYEIELGADPDPIAYFHSSQATESGLNLSNYSNSLVDDLLVSARETTDKTLRKTKYETFLSYFVSDVPAIGLYQSTSTYVYNQNVNTYSDDLNLVTALDRFNDITSWAINKTTKNLTP